MMTADDYRQLKTFSTWLEQFVNDGEKILAKEPAAHNLRKALDLMEEAHRELAKVAFADVCEPRH
jgi:hypothetical protein